MKIHLHLKKLLASMTPFVSISYTLLRIWKNEEVFTAILVVGCLKKALAGLPFGRTKPREVPQSKQIGKFKLVLVVSQMRRTKCF